ncbi:hypothetical protein A7E78_04680 [Syntrophotalea acetylenivorans]|uniref:Uncharacterized protein n=1 Tax=Syntrophotalea acetylenivorans TaxID=1842532 RepID=A0A1L3GMR5_9BACT|nr:hypothetical protein [Syntrophotalea acetylenivorans]APG27191.1 hypothetical protein A7E78_04680 [Syntrophotalea acetylenivorans]
MLLRFFTSILLLAMFLPVGVFGAVIHRCETEKSVVRMSCCQGAENDRLTADGVEQLTHRCQIQTAPVVQQPASLSHKIEIDAASLVGVDISTIPSLRLTASIHQISSVRVSLYSPGGGAPVFLTTCSFLI